MDDVSPARQFTMTTFAQYISTIKVWLSVVAFAGAITTIAFINQGRDFGLRSSHYYVFYLFLITSPYVTMFATSFLVCVDTLGRSIMFGAAVVTTGLGISWLYEACYVNESDMAGLALFIVPAMQWIVFGSVSLVCFLTRRQLGQTETR